MFYQFGVLLLVGTYLSAATALPPCVCTRERRPVCGSDGETYSNKCLLECQRSLGKKDLEIEKYEPCEEEPPVCICTYDYKPVCGSNGVTYPNECSLQCEVGLKVAYEGQCKTKREDVSIAQWSPCTCTRERKPVCGTDGLTYSNPCLLNCAREVNEDLHIDHVGQCVNERVEPAENLSCTCAKNMEPMCASDGVTYNNMCLLECAGAKLAHYGPC